MVGGGAINLALGADKPGEGDKGDMSYFRCPRENFSFSGKLRGESDGLG